MNNGHSRLDVRFIVFSVEDAVEQLKQLLKSVKTSDIEPDDSGIVPAILPRAARWTIRNEHDDSVPRRDPHMNPLMLNLWFLFYDRRDLVGILTHLIHLLPGQVDPEDFVPGAHDDIPGNGMNGPMGLWELTRVHVEPPTAYRFDDTPIWNY
jgi:hypothetical protein